MTLINSAVTEQLQKEWNSESLTLKFKVKDIDNLAEGRPPNAFRHPAKESKKIVFIIYSSIKYLSRNWNFPCLTLILKVKGMDVFAENWLTNVTCQTCLPKIDESTFGRSYTNHSVEQEHMDARMDTTYGNNQVLFTPDFVSGKNYRSSLKINRSV